MTKRSKNQKSLLNIFNIFLIITSLSIIISFAFSWAKLKNTFKDPEIVVSGSIVYDQKSYISHINKVSGKIANELSSKQLTVKISP